MVNFARPTAVDQEYIAAIQNVHPIQMEGDIYRTLDPRQHDTPAVVIEGIEDPVLTERSYLVGKWIVGGGLHIDANGDRLAKSAIVSTCPELALFAAYVAVRDGVEVPVEFNFKRYTSRIEALSDNFKDTLHARALGLQLFANQQIIVQDSSILERGNLNDREKTLVAAGAIDVFKGLWEQL